MEKEYLPYVGRDVWIKMESVTQFLSLRSLGIRQMVYNVYSWAEDALPQSCNYGDVVREKPTDIKFSVFSIPSHGWVKALKVRLTTTGVLPSPLLAGTDYWVIVVDDSRIQLATTELHARGGVPIYLSTQGSGSHNFETIIEDGPWTPFRWVPFGLRNY
jgi:hypothetical protein